MNIFTFEPRDPEYKQKVHDSFARQGAMETLGASIVNIEPGKVILELPFKPGLSQQHGFLHAGILATMLDTAAGYSAYSLMPPEAAVLTVEFKTSLIAPARGSEFRFEGQVVKPGRTITFCEANAFAVAPGQMEKKVASMTATMMAVTGRDDVKG